MALDEPNDGDTQFDIDGFKYIVNKEFLDRAQPISIDFQMYGFKLDSALEFQAGGCACGTDKKRSCGC
jgi:Fe-S cluster assembly iron-binding protein IscA